MPSYRLLVPITGLFVASLLIANTLDTKMFQVGGLSLTAGILVFPLSYVFGDILTEVYGYSASRKVIWTGFGCLVLMVVMYEVAGLLPPADFWHNQEAFSTIFTQVPRIVAASIIAYLCGEFVNSVIVAKMKVAQGGKRMGLRFIVSTVAGEAVDTVVFVTIAFAGSMPLAALSQITLSAWAVKVGWEIVALPLTLIVVKRIKRIEKLDVFDTDTNFSPFKL
jgi:uncharacterized integral membrane protein (TIGR00697 family)